MYEPELGETVLVKVGDKKSGDSNWTVGRVLEEGNNPGSFSIETSNPEVSCDTVTAHKEDIKEATDESVKKKFSE